MRVGKEMTKKAIILFSGGLDSTTCLAIAKSQGYDCYALSIQYGQKHDVEVECAKAIAKKFSVKAHKILSIPIDQFKGSSLTDSEVAVPDFQESSEVPSTYVPARNTIFLSLALAWAEVVCADDIFIGANEMDYSGYPDCRPKFLHSFEEMAMLGTKRGVEGHRLTIHSPLLRLSKAEIIKLGVGLGVDYGMTISCYRASSDGKSCGKCDSCTYRKKGFLEAEIEDPTDYN